jgi:hypothetical protein
VSDPAQRLWFTPDRARFFLVPDGPMPEGDLAVRSLQATSAAVDEAWMSSHEVGVEAARTHVDAGWEEVVGQIRDTWRSLASALGGGEPAEGDEPPDLGRWLGVTPGEVVTDPDKRRQGKRTLIERATRLLRPAATEDDIDRFEARFDRVGAAIQRDAERLRSEGDRLARALDERRPDLEAAAESAGQQVVDLGRAALDRLRGGPRTDSGGGDGDSDGDGSAEPSEPTEPGGREP